MSDEKKIEDRPYPFDVKTRILQLVGLAISTPRDVADINLEIKPAWDLFEVSVYVGGYDGKKNPNSQFSKSLYFAPRNTDELIKQLDELIASVNATTADGRKIKAKRIRDEIAELQKKAEALESEETLSATQP